MALLKNYWPSRLLWKLPIRDTLFPSTQKDESFGLNLDTLVPFLDQLSFQSTANELMEAISLVKTEQRKNVKGQMTRITGYSETTVSLTTGNYSKLEAINGIHTKCDANWPTEDDEKLENLSAMADIHAYSEDGPFILYPIIVWGDPGIAISETEDSEVLIQQLLDDKITNGWNKWRILSPLIQVMSLKNKDAAGFTRLWEGSRTIDITKYYSIYLKSNFK